MGDASGGAARVLQLNLGDDGDDDRFAAILPTVIAFVRDATRDPNAVIFVHCKSGVNRAPSLAMALLISLERYSLVSAFSAVRAARPSVRPKYIKTVAVYEQQALHRSSAPALRDGPNSSEFCDLYFRRAEIPPTGRGAAAGCHVDIPPTGRGTATGCRADIPRTSRGDAAAGTWKSGLDLRALQVLRFEGGLFERWRAMEGRAQAAVVRVCKRIECRRTVNISTPHALAMSKKPERTQ